ncbi:MAG: intradiol ring-cleavage dioxygenase [Burkholderiales bacterium]
MANRNSNAQTLTAEALRRIGKAPDARVKEAIGSLIRHLHGFVREVKPTQEEWFRGIQFLTQTGQWCDEKRQEWILLSDTTGVSMLVDFINYGRVGNATESTVLGPFFVEGAPEMQMGADIARPGTPGEPCVASGTVKDMQGRPIAGAILDVWEAQGDGFYDVQKPGEHNARARLRTAADGRYWFHCVKPSSYPVPHDGPVGRMLSATGRHPMRPGHLHFKISAPGFDTLVTHLFVKGDEYLGSDAVFGVKQSLIVDFRKNKSGEYECRYDFVLRPEGLRKAPAKRKNARKKKAK